MINDTILSAVRSHPGVKKRLIRALTSIGYDTTDWVRVIMYQRCFTFVQSLGPEGLDALEISAGLQWRTRFVFRSYTKTEYPQFDICAGRLPQQFDLIIADQVFEHLKWPYRAGRNVLDMLRPGGYFVISVPFLLRLHGSPIDCSRWSEAGLSFFLQECGFPESGIMTDSWGNRACVVANFKTWRKRGFFGSLQNEPNFPVMVWAFAQKAGGTGADQA